RLSFWCRSYGRFLRLIPYFREQGIELACLFERIEIVAAADMRPGDENLRECAAAVGARDHFPSRVPVPTGIDLVEADALAGQQFLGIGAVGTVTDRIDIDIGHDDR